MPELPNDSALDVVVVPRSHDLGDNFVVRRALPSREKRMVGPFVFLDQMGPHLFTSGRGLAASKAGIARLVLLGGEAMDGPRYLAWNFVSSSTERIEQAKKDWREQNFPKVPAETEFIPLPELMGRPVRFP